MPADARSDTLRPMSTQLAEKPKVAYAHPATPDDIPWSEESLEAYKEIRQVKPTLVIGDCHGHLDRLEALLTQEGIIGVCPECDGTGDDLRPPESEFCVSCTGTGIARINHDVEVVQLGDLGHYGADSMGKDRLIWEYAPRWVDVILWGNHDRAIIDGRHFFMGYQKPLPETTRAIDQAILKGQIRIAHAAHGFLFTHAGLHACFKHQKIPVELKRDIEQLVDWLNECDGWSANEPAPDEDEFLAIVNAISRMRGGPCDAGGILWRDARESYYPDFRQVFGHTARDTTCRTYESPVGNSYCIDVGDKHNGRLMGMWLPDERVVEVHVPEKIRDLHELTQDDPVLDEVVEKYSQFLR